MILDYNWGVKCSFDGKILHYQIPISDEILKNLIKIVVELIECLRSKW